MKFVIGLLAGSLSVLALTTVVDFDWQPPTRLQAPLSTMEVLGSDLASVPESVSRLISESDPGPESEPEPILEPIRSVTVAPLPPEPAPEPAPKPQPESQPSLRAFASSTPSAEPVNDPVPEAVANETAVIWKPFHSEVSAEGFARRLSTQLGYPFRALRDGPARYHVVFDYGSDQQRELLRDQVRALTGFSVL